MSLKRSESLSIALYLLSSGMLFVKYVTVFWMGVGYLLQVVPILFYIYLYLYIYLISDYIIYLSLCYLFNLYLVYLY